MLSRALMFETLEHYHLHRLLARKITPGIFDYWNFSPCKKEMTVL